jgi:hypothetical protein
MRGKGLAKFLNVARKLAPPWLAEGCRLPLQNLPEGDRGQGNAIVQSWAFVRRTDNSASRPACSLRDPAAVSAPGTTGIIGLTVGPLSGGTHFLEGGLHHSFPTITTIRTMGNGMALTNHLYSRDAS